MRLRVSFDERGHVVGGKQKKKKNNTADAPSEVPRRPMSQVVVDFTARFVSCRSRGRTGQETSRRPRRNGSFFKTRETIRISVAAAASVFRVAGRVSAGLWTPTPRTGGYFFPIFRSERL